jgi:aerobic carbon-monoxide dehydrogenase large subunit
MSTRVFGEPVRRLEDPRLLTGRATFVDDVALPGTLHVAFLRSSVAHGRLRGVDAGAARRRPGVVEVLVAEDLGELWQPGPLLVPPPPIEGWCSAAHQVPLARDKVRHVGEPVAVVVAESRYLAEDARERHPVADSSRCRRWSTSSARSIPAPARPRRPRLQPRGARDPDQGRLTAARARRPGVRRRFPTTAAPPPRSRTAASSPQWDPRDELTVWDTTQAPIVIRNGLAAMLGLSSTRCA